MVRITFVLLICALTLACSSAAQQLIEPTALEPTAVEPAPKATPGPLQPPPNTDSVPPLILEEMDRLYPDYGTDAIILTDGPTMTLYCRSAGRVQVDENGFVTSVVIGNEQWLGAPVYQAAVPQSVIDNPAIEHPGIEGEAVDYQDIDYEAVDRELKDLDFAPASSPAMRLSGLGGLSGDVHVDESGNLVSGAAICRRISSN